MHHVQQGKRLSQVPHCPVEPVQCKEANSSPWMVKTKLHCKHSATRTLNKSNPGILDIGASVSKLRHPNEVQSASYQKCLHNVDELVVGSAPTECLGKSKITISKLELDNSVHAKNLNGTLISVGHLGDADSAVFFTKQ